MRISFPGPDNYSLSLLGSILIILLSLFSSSDYAEAQNQPKEEKTIMQASEKNILPLDLQVWAQTETATFAMG
jgi:hypothetical protein